jgi:hypothetical protein
VNTFGCTQTEAHKFNYIRTSFLDPPQPSEVVPFERYVQRIIDVCVSKEPTDLDAMCYHPKIMQIDAGTNLTYYLTFA